MSRIPEWEYDDAMHDYLQWQNELERLLADKEPCEESIQEAKRIIADYEEALFCEEEDAPLCAEVKSFLDIEIGDRVICMDEYSRGTPFHELVIDSFEDDEEYATESNPTGRRYWGTDQDYVNEDGEFEAGDNEYVSIVTESSFVSVVEDK